MSTGPRQTALMQNEQRPWIKVMPVVDKGTLGGLTWINGNAMILFRNTVSNVGRSPAFNVKTRIESLQPTASYSNIVMAERKVCDKAAKWTLQQRQGVTLFPGEKDDSPEGDHTVWGVNIHPLNGMDITQVIIMECADYVFGSPPVHHQTGYIYILARRIRRVGDTDAMSYQFPYGKNIPGDDIIIERTEANTISIN